MWPFKRKKPSREADLACIPCPYCRTSDTKIITHHGSGEADYVRVWRGQRYITCRCLNCGQDFYTEESGAMAEVELNNDDLIDDAEALRKAEDDLKRQVDDEDDRTFHGC
jgi:hypothetical protein